MKAVSKTGRLILLGVVLLVAGLLVGYLLRGGHAPRQAAQEEVEGIEYVCPMHPTIRQSTPGNCPICGMPLEPVKIAKGAEGLGLREVRLSPAAVKLAEVRTAPVERRFVEAEVRMVGKLVYDETRLGTITARVPGRLDRLYVDYTGIAVRKGDHLFDIYSPELLTAQQELLETLKTVRQLEASSAAPGAVESARLTLAAVREKLRLLDLTPEQIAEIEERGTAVDHVTIYAPLGGIVVGKHAVEGTYVKTGMPVYTIADLTRVWAKLDAYESDLAWVRYGQAVTFETDAYPGERFDGTIAFIDPVLDEQTRTVKVRVNVENLDGKLKPGMFVRAVVRAKLAAGGRVMNAALAGKWICPMHPEIVKDGPGTCDVCGMPLVRAETLGYVTAEAAEPPLVIPASAPLITGKRAVVYVKSPTEDGVFTGREIVLGPRAGDFYLVHSGLEEGELVVAHGAFKIDSAVQLSAKPSMMQPAESHGPTGGETTPAAERNVPPGEGEGKVSVVVPDQFKAKLDPVYAAYFAVEDALSKDDADTAKAAANDLATALDAVKTESLEAPALTAWRERAALLAESAAEVAGAENLTTAREAFAPLSDTVYSVIEEFGASGAEGIWRFHCPMAFGGTGAYWLQNSEEPANPYFGSVMLGCQDAKQGLVAPATTNREGDEHE